MCNNRIMADARAAVAVSFLAFFAAPAAGCGDDAGGDPDAAAEIDAAPADPTEALFDPERLLEIEIDLAPADWDVLRYQRHEANVVFGQDCYSGPIERPYTYFEADITIDGETIESVGVRKKGFLGSVSATRPSLKVSFDEYVPGQRYSGMERLTLNNNQQDASQMNTCLTYGVFRAAGLPAPRCNYALVTVNGEYKGVFSNVESIKKPFLARHFDDAEGNLYEGAISDFRTDWINTFQKKTNEIDPDRSDLAAVQAALEAPDGEVQSRLDAVLDVDEFLTFWAAEVLTGHWDSYTNNTNNFYIYDDPTDGRFHFIPWGPDSTFGSWDIFQRFEPPASLFANGAIARRLFDLPATRAEYLARLEELLTEVWDETALQAEVDRVEALVGDHVHVSHDLFEEEVSRVRSFIDGKRSAVEAELDAGGPTWDHSLRSSMCGVSLGAIDATFSTTWGVLLPDVPIGHGNATFDLTLLGETPTWTLTGSTAGPDEKERGLRYGVAAFGLLGSTGKVNAATVLVEPELFAAGQSIPIDGYDAFGVLVEIDIDTRSMRFLGFLDGTLTLDEAGTESGAAVSGSISAEVTGPAFWLDE